MKLNTRRRFPAWCLVLLAACAIPASAQWTTTGSSCSSCQVPSPLVTSVPMPAPVYQAMAPVQTTVQTPVAYTQYVNQPVTQMVPVTRQQTRQVPSVQYRTVTQYQTRNRDMGRWVTRYTPNRRLSPCQVDPRPGFSGWMNRTGYELRNMFTPQYSSRREYIPNVVAQSVPVTRRVAVPSTRTVAYNVTQMVPQTVNRQVAVNRVRYVTQSFNSVPTLAMQPTGVAPSVAWAPSTVSNGAVAWDPFGGSLAAAPIVDSTPYDQMAVMTENEFERRVALDDKMQPIPDRDISRSARGDHLDENLFGDDEPVRSSRSSRAANDRYEPRKRSSEKTDKSIRKSSFSRTPPANRMPATSRTPATSRFNADNFGGDDFGDDSFINEPAAAPRTNVPPPRTQTPPPHANPTAQDEDFFDEIPNYDQGSGGATDAFDDIQFDEGVQFDEQPFEPSASRSRYGRPTAMRPAAHSRVVRDDGWNASRPSTRSRSQYDNSNRNTILVANELP